MLHPIRSNQNRSVTVTGAGDVGGNGAGACGCGCVVYTVVCGVRAKEREWRKGPGNGLGSAYGGVPGCVRFRQMANGKW